MDAPHRLGRHPNPPDERDWDTARLHAHMTAVAPPVSDAVLDGTVREAAAAMTTWKQVLAFASALWAWIKHKPTPPPAPPPAPNLWPDPVVLDQGNYGTCVGNAGAGWLASAPVEDPGVDETTARALYYEATCFDGKCDSTYQGGSTSRSLAKALVARKRASAYAFARNMAELDEWLAGHGPVPIGIDWTEDMFDPDPDGLVHVTGAVAGGHEPLVRYREPGTTRYRVRNSWGPGWGDKGDFLIEAADLERLLFEQGGDALLIAELPL